jgi:hypothetical protein
MTIKEYTRFNKVVPKINHFIHTNHHYYIYCYLNPFEEVFKTYELLIDKRKTMVNFGYTPIYIGKATGHGFRHNQHIKEFLSGKETKISNDKSNITHTTTFNKYKHDMFHIIDTNMKHLQKEIEKGVDIDPIFPTNWKEYQKSWIIILSECSSPDELREVETSIINTIGTIKQNRGPLVNILTS